MNSKKLWTGAIGLLLAMALTACGGADTLVSTNSGSNTSDTPATFEGVETGDSTDGQNPSDSQPTSPNTGAGTSPTQPAVGHGIFEGLTLSQIWDKVMNNMEQTTGLDLSVNSKSDYTVEGEVQKEEQDVRIQFNAASDGYSYAVTQETHREVDSETYDESLYQAYKDGWFYMAGDMDGESGSAKIALSADDLTEHGLDMETILALNSIIDTSSLTVYGDDLEKIFQEVRYEELGDGRSKIVCSKIRVDKLMELLNGNGEDSSEQGEIGSLLGGLDELMDCSFELTISENGMPEKITANVELNVTEPMAFVVKTEYSVTINAIGANAGVVTIPESAQEYPEFESFEAFLESIYSDMTEE